MSIGKMVGKTFDAVMGMEVGSDEIVFKAEDGTQFYFFHTEDCCESVLVEDVAGDPSDLTGAPMLYAAEIGQGHDDNCHYGESCTWTFYRFTTIKGSVVVRWLGTSNGYYSERVAFSIRGASE